MRVLPVWCQSVSSIAHIPCSLQGSTNIIRVDVVGEQKHLFSCFLIHRLLPGAMRCGVTGVEPASGTAMTNQTCWTRGQKQTNRYWVANLMQRGDAIVPQRPAEADIA